MYNLICIGDPVIDTHVQLAEECAQCRELEAHKTHLCFEYGAKIPIIDSFQSLGGNAANVAVAAAKFGLQTAVVSTIGDDLYGKMAAEALNQFGVATDYIGIDPATQTRYSIVLNYKAERTILSYSDTKQYRWPQPFPETEWIYYSGGGAGYEKLYGELHRYLDKRKTVRLAVNPNSFMLKFALDDMRQLATRADLLIVNVQEAEKILGSSLQKEKNQTALLHELTILGAKEVVLTDGANGAWAGTTGETWHLAAYPVKVVAKTGAGDACSAAYITARSRGHDIPHALEWGVANSCSVIAEHGPHKGLLNEKGIMRMIEKFSKLKPMSIF